MLPRPASDTSERHTDGSACVAFALTARQLPQQLAPVNDRLAVTAALHPQWRVLHIVGVEEVADDEGTLLSPLTRLSQAVRRLGPPLLAPHRVQGASRGPVDAVRPELRVPHQHRVIVKVLEPRHGIVCHHQLGQIQQAYGS